MSETPLTPEQARDLEREERRAALLRIPKSQLIVTHRQGAGCLMSAAELRLWSREELANAIVDGEFGHRDPEPDPESEEATPCGEGMCRCHCTSQHGPCGCDCPRDEDGQLLEDI